MENLLPIGQLREALTRTELLEEVQEECHTTGCAALDTCGPILYFAPKRTPGTCTLLFLYILHRRDGVQGPRGGGGAGAAAVGGQ